MYSCFAAATGYMLTWLLACTRSVAELAFNDVLLKLGASMHMCAAHVNKSANAHAQAPFNTFDTY
eukprot:6206419-Pleurochrysis_carterae.AAC.2